MSGFDVREYQSVILGALLHDVGKFMQRAEVEKLHPAIEGNYDDFCPLNEHGRPGYLHAAHTAWFVEHLIPDDLMDKTELYNAARHHKNPSGDIYKEADCLSSGMESYGEEGDLSGYKDVRLFPVFDMVELKYAIRDRAGLLNCRWKHRLAACSDSYLTEAFPVFSDDRVFVDEFTYKKLWDGFRQEIEEIRTISDFQTYFNEIYWLLEKYTWCIPSATNAYLDISLFDHSKTTAAIAATLYIFNNEGKQEKPEFLLYAGDISGIQDYIFRISGAQGVGGIAKRLRGRSFYIAMLSEALSRYIIREVGLTQANVNFCGGGNFELLLPNTGEVNKTLTTFEADVNNWLLEEFHGELGFIGAQVEMAKRDLRTAYAVKKDMLADELNNAKLRKYRTHICTEEFWKEQGGKKGRKTVCRSCNLNLVEHKDDICMLCSLDKTIGEELPRARYISFSPSALMQQSIVFGKFGYVALWAESDGVPVVNAPDSAVYSFLEEARGCKARYSLARTVPAATKDIALETEQDDSGNKTVRPGQPLSFTTLADMATGDKRIGILKMDVDNLGLIFSLGLEAAGDSGRQGSMRSISRLSTLSRQISVFFTRHLDNICSNIFKNWLHDPENRWEHKDSVSNIFYLIFAGGDDLVIVGPWDRIIELAREIRKKFKDFTCHNPNVTLSAGIYICKPKYPISHAVEKAEEAMKQSKSKGRNRTTVMGETAVWADEDEKSRIYQQELRARYPGDIFRKNEIGSEKVFVEGLNDARDFPTLTFEELWDFAALLQRNLRDKKISRKFVHSLLEAREEFFTRMYSDEHDRIEEKRNLMSLPYLLYSIQRNVQKEAKDEFKRQLVTSGDEGKYIRQAYYPCKCVLMKTRQ